MCPESSYPRRPFLARGAHVQRCEQCKIAWPGCICEFRVETEAKARFWLLTHRKEHYKPSNTGRLIVDTIRDSEVFEWSRTQPDPVFTQLLGDPAFDPYIVFPEGQDYQHRMVDFEQKPGRKPVFIILDGTWRQARRMFRHSAYLKDIPVIQPSAVQSTRYNLRKPNEGHHLCTAEVAAVMLSQIGDQQGAAVLDAYFDLFNAYYYASKMQRPVEAVDDAKAVLDAAR
ncbi:MAG: tRNA-uridine aminocarboxypropyltransferase [Pontibacterium sp.]